MSIQMMHPVPTPINAPTYAGNYLPGGFGAGYPTVPMPPVTRYPPGAFNVPMPPVVSRQTVHGAYVQAGVQGVQQPNIPAQYNPYGVPQQQVTDESMFFAQYQVQQQTYMMNQPGAAGGYPIPMVQYPQQAQGLPQPATMWTQRSQQQIAQQQRFTAQPSTRFQFSGQLTTSQAQHLQTARPTVRRANINSVPELQTTFNPSYGTQSAR